MRVPPVQWILLVAGTASAAVRFPPPRPPSHEIVIENRVPVPMRDGVILYADVYRPAKEGTYPVLVSRTPYSTERAPASHTQPVFFARRGYVFVLQDVRGRHESQGEWEPFRNNQRDGYDTVEWAARQPWSNGKVGMQGASYLGHVQWQAAMMEPPHLVAIFPNLAPASVYHDLVTINGGFLLSFGLNWGAVRQESRIMQNPGVHSLPGGPEGLEYDRVLWHLPLLDMQRLVGRKARFFTDWLKHPDYDDYWKVLNVEEVPERIRVPAHTFGGWFDNHARGELNAYVEVSRKGKTAAAREKSRMLMGPWGHGPTRKYGDIDFGAHALIDPQSVELRWFDYWLQGIDNGIQNEPPVTIFVMGRNVWRHENEYPLARTQYRKMYFHSGGKANSSRGDGRLSWDVPPASSPPDRYRYDPEHPVPSVGGHRGPMDQRPVESRNDVLVYTSDFLEQEVEVTGPVKVLLYAASDAPDTDLVAKLVDVHPDGRAFNVAEGILHARHRESLSHPKPMQAGEVYPIEIDLIGTSNVFLRGHRIRVDVTSSHFPQFARNQNTGEPFGTTAATRVATQTIHHSSRRPSHIVLPVIP